MPSVQLCALLIYYHTEMPPSPKLCAQSRNKEKNSVFCVTTLSFLYTITDYCILPGLRTNTPVSLKGSRIQVLKSAFSIPRHECLMDTCGRFTLLRGHFNGGKKQHFNSSFFTYLLEKKPLATINLSCPPKVFLPPLCVGLPTSLLPLVSCSFTFFSL